MYYNPKNDLISTLSYIFNKYHDATIIERFEDIHKLITEGKLIELSFRNQKNTGKYYINKLKEFEENMLYKEEEYNFKMEKDGSDIFKCLLLRIGYHHLPINYMDSYDEDDIVEYYDPSLFNEKFENDKYLKLFINYKLIIDNYSKYGSEDEYIIQWKFFKMDKFKQFVKKLNDKKVK